MMLDTPLPLRETIVLDLTRMLPGAVLARQLLDLGARVIKVEPPGQGDLMRYAPPLVDDIGAGFAFFFAGAESIAVDLDSDDGVTTLRRLLCRADVLVDSFRPGALKRRGLDPGPVLEENPRLVWCSLSGYGTGHAAEDRPAHDLNMVAETAALPLMAGTGLPRIPLADVGTGLLATTAITAALLERERTGRGSRLEQPLAFGPLPFVAWPWAETLAGGLGPTHALLAGDYPCYRTYRCPGGNLAVAALEPKFWTSFLEMLNLEGFVGAAFATGDAAEQAVTAIHSKLQERTREEWVEMSRERGLPVSPVSSPEEAVADPASREAGLLDAGTALPAPFHPSLGRRVKLPPPRAGEHTDAVLAELEID